MPLDADLKVIADPTRMSILEFLRAPVAEQCRQEDGVCACDLETYLGLSQPTISHHMKQLVAAGFVRSQRHGRWTHYELDAERFRAVGAELLALATDAERGSVPGS